MKSLSKQQDEEKTSKSILIHQIHIQSEREDNTDNKIVQNGDKRKSVMLYDKFQELKAVRHNNLCNYIDMREQRQLQNRYLIFQEAYDCSIQDLAFRRTQNNVAFTELELTQIAYSILKGIIYLQEKHNIEVGFFTPNQVFYCSENRTYRLNNFGQFYLDAYNKLPENLEDLIFRPPEYYILGQERAKHGEFSCGKGEIWSLGLLLRYCMADTESLAKEDDLMSKYFIPLQTKININQETNISNTNLNSPEKKINKLLQSTKKGDQAQELNENKCQKNDSEDSRLKRDVLNNCNESEDNENILQTGNEYETEEAQHQQIQFKINRSMLIEDILTISADQRYHSTSTFLKTSYYLPYLNPFQEYLNGYKGVSKQFSYLFRDFVSKCLYLNPQLRPSPLELISHPIFQQLESPSFNDTASTTPTKNQNNSKSIHERSNDQEELNEEKQEEDDFSEEGDDDEEQANQNLLNENNEELEDIEADRIKNLYRLIMQKPKRKKLRLNRAYDEVVKKGNLKNVEDLFPLEIVIDIIYNEIEPNILSHATITKTSKKEMFKPFIFNCIKGQQPAGILNKQIQNIISDQDNSYFLRIDCKPIYQHIVNEISYYQNVLKNVKDLQTLADYLGLNFLNHHSTSFKAAQERNKAAAKNALNLNNTVQLEQSQFLNQSLMLNESTIYQNYDQNNQTYLANNLNLSTILNDPDLSMCIPNQQIVNKQMRQPSQGVHSNQQLQQQQTGQQLADASFFNEEIAPNSNTTTSTNASNQKQQQQQAQQANLKQKEPQQTEQQKLQQQQQDLDKSSTSIGFGFFKKMKISEKVSKLWGSNKNDGQNGSGIQGQQTNVGSNQGNNSQQQNQSNQKQGGSATGISQTQNQGGNTTNNDLFANSSIDNDGEFQPFPINMIMPNNSISPKIKEYLFYMNLFYEDRRIVSPKQIPQYLIQVELPSLLRSELYKKVIVLPSKSNKLFNFLVSIPLMYPEKVNDLKQIENDLPRCHQYTEYCASQKGQKQIQETLYAFLNLNSNYYYLQGMDAMAFVSLQATQNNSSSALLILQDVVKKSLLMHQSAQQSPEDYIMKEKILIYKWLLRLEDPQLSDYLEEKQFYPEIYTISWFLNIFSMVFDIQTVLKIWDFIICDCNFSLCFAVSLMIELKDYLMMKDSNELMSSIRNLEGVINTKNCWKYAQYLMKTLPETFLALNYIQNENERNDYQKEFFSECPWEIPPIYSILSKRPIFYASVFDLLKQKHVIYIDIRSKEEYETVCMKNSLYAHFINGRVNEVVLSYLEKKSNKLTSFENFEESQVNEFMSLIVIVFNYEKQQDMLDAVHQFLGVGVRRLVVLNGGIQCIQRDRPDLLDFKHRIHPINYYKRKQQ